MWWKNSLIAVILSLLLLSLPVSQAQEFEPTPFEPMRPEHLPAPQSPYSNPLNSQALQVLLNSLSTIFNIETITGLLSEVCSGFILQLIELLKTGGSISGYLNIVLNIVNGIYTTLASAAVGILGVLPSGIVAILSGGVAILNTVGTLFVAALQAIGFTIEGIVGLTAIGGIISGVMSLVSLFLNVLNFAYTSGVAGIAVVALLLVVLSFVGLAVLGGIVVVLAAGEAILFVLVAVLFVIGFFAAIVTLGLACILFGIVITILTGMSAIGFTIMAVIELIMKVMTTLMNTVSVPTSVFTSIPSWLVLLFCNLPASCLTALLPWLSTVLSCCYTAYPIVVPIVIIILYPFMIIISSMLALILPVVYFAALGFLVGLLFFIIGCIPGFIVGVIVGFISGGILWLVTAFILIVISPLLLLFWLIGYIVNIPINTIVLPFFVMLITYICSGAFSVFNFLGIGADAITGFAGLIVTGITLMLLRVGIDLMQTTLISEVVAVLVLFLQKLQEISFLTKMAAYPIEVCVGITMLCAAICMFLLNILFYPFNFVWQYVELCAKGCYGVVCRPFIRPLGWE